MEEAGAAGGEYRDTGAIPREPGPAPGTVPGQGGRPGKRSRRTSEGEPKKITMEIPNELAAEDVLSAVERVLAIKIREGKGLTPQLRGGSSPLEQGRSRSLEEDRDDAADDEEESVVEVDSSGNRKNKLYGPSGFPKTRHDPGYEFYASFDTENYDNSKISHANVSKEGTLGCPITSIHKSDEIFLKLIGGLRYHHQKDDFLEFVDQVVELALASGASQKMSKVGIFNGIVGPGRSIISDMGPMKTPYIELTLKEYVEALKLRLCNVTELKIARKTYQARRQEAGEGPKSYFYVKIKWYKRCHSLEQRDFNMFLEEFVKGLTNCHLQDYLTMRASVMNDEQDLLESINQGVLYIMRQVDNKRISRSEMIGLKDRASPEEAKAGEKAINEITVPEDQGEGKEDLLANISLRPKTKKTVNNKQGQGTSTSSSTGERCYYCDIPGHYAKECFRKRKDVRAGTYKFKPARINEVQESSGSESSSTDSDTAEVCHLMKEGHLSTKKGRRIVRSLARNKNKSAGRRGVRNHNVLPRPTATIDNTEELTEDIRLLQVQMADLQEQLNNNLFLGQPPAWGKESAPNRRK